VGQGRQGPNRGEEENRKGVIHAADRQRHAPAGLVNSASIMRRRSCIRVSQVGNEPGHAGQQRDRLGDVPRGWNIEVEHRAHAVKLSGRTLPRPMRHGTLAPPLKGYKILA
jgi:hypothetical protein